MTLSLSTVVNSKSGWYRGDLHAHTTCSPDGHLSPQQLLETARAEGLHFLAVTDHNTTEAFYHFDSRHDLLIIPGIEVTLEEGHFNVFGLNGNPSDWLTYVCDTPSGAALNGRYATTTHILREIASEGLLTSINHPLRLACRWFDDTTDLRYPHCIEIWNKPSFTEHAEPNRQAIELWTRLLNAGHRVSAIGGSDYHRPIPEPGQKKPPERLGEPSTYVYAGQLSADAILQGIALGRVYVSMGARVSLTAHVGNRRFDIGADLGEIQDDILFSATVSDCPVMGYARVVKNGNIMAEKLIAPGVKTHFKTHDLIKADRPAWYRLDVFDRQGHLLAITNPIFAGPYRRPTSLYFGDFTSTSVELA